MALRLRRPNEDDLQPQLEAGRIAAFTYGPVGLVSLAEPPAGFRRSGGHRALGVGDEVFAGACDTLCSWGMHRGAGLIVLAEGPPKVGQTVAMSAPLPLGYIDAVCRIVDVVDTAERRGFSYGTLPNHPETGEESFTLLREPNGLVKIEIVAVSRHRNLLARAVPAFARSLQRSATERYLDALQRAVRQLPFDEVR
ncbi:MAG: DUF1990 domain-containing protein [Actinobacteria bacterium]|nr:DUF1990 domain-containing protein [Actinomycetota bacterium]